MGHSRPDRDSERYFLHLMWRLAARDGGMVAAITDTTADISQRYTASSLNAILLAPDALYAISFHDRSMVPADLLRQLGHGDRPEEVDRRTLATSVLPITLSLVSGWVGQWGENTSLIALMASMTSTSAVAMRVSADAGTAAGWPGRACSSWAASRRSASDSCAVSKRRCCRK